MNLYAVSAGSYLLPVSLRGCRWILNRLLLWGFRRIWQREFLQRRLNLLTGHKHAHIRSTISPSTHISSPLFCNWPLTALQKQTKMLSTVIYLVLNKKRHNFICFRKSGHNDLLTLQYYWYLSLFADIGDNKRNFTFSTSWQVCTGEVPRIHLVLQLNESSHFNLSLVYHYLNVVVMFQI